MVCVANTRLVEYAPPGFDDALDFWIRAPTRVGTAFVVTFLHLLYPADWIGKDKGMRWGISASNTPPIIQSCPPLNLRLNASVRWMCVFDAGVKGKEEGYGIPSDSDASVDTTVITVDLTNLPQPRLSPHHETRRL